MNNDTSTWQNQFSQGFSTSGGNDNLGIVLIFLGIVAVLVAVWFLLDRYRKYQKKMAKTGPHIPAEDGARVRMKFVPVAGRLNPLQQKIIRELIDEFRKNEDSAQTVPSSVLEKFSEFFFDQLPRMKTNEKDVEDFINQNFPLQEGFHIELDFPSSGALHLIKAKVQEISGKNLVVEFRPPIPEFLKKGMPLHLNYNVGKHFLQGSSAIIDIRPDMGLILRKPHDVIVTGERRYSRIGLENATGALADPRTTFNEAVKVLDLSLEGVRIQVGRPLKKGTIYQLIFGEKREDRSWGFGPIECVPSQAFLTSSGTNEAGLLFLYLDMATRSRMIAYMKQRVQELQERREAEAADAKE